jgi:hypothetical protein
MASMIFHQLAVKSMTYNVMCEKDDKDKGKHGGETGLDDATVSVPLLEPSRGKDGEDRAEAGALSQPRLPGGRELIADFFVHIDAEPLAKGRDTVKVALPVSACAWYLITRLLTGRAVS